MKKTEVTSSRIAHIAAKGLRTGKVVWHDVPIVINPEKEKT